MAWDNMISGLNNRLQTMRAGFTSASGATAGPAAPAPQDGNAGSVEPKRSKLHLLWTGPLVDPQGWRELAQGAKGIAQAGARVATQTACAGTQLPGLQFLPHADNSRFFLPDHTEVRTASGQAQDGRRQGSVVLMMPDHRQVAVEEASTATPNGQHGETRPDTVWVRASALGPDKQPLKAGVIRNHATGHPEVHILNPGSDSITMIDLTDYHSTQGGADAAKMLSGAPDGWVQAGPSAPAPPPPPHVPAPRPEPPPTPRAQPDMEAIILGH